MGQAPAQWMRTLVLSDRTAILFGVWDQVNRRQKQTRIQHTHTHTHTHTSIGKQTCDSKVFNFYPNMFNRFICANNYCAANWSRSRVNRHLEIARFADWILRFDMCGLVKFCAQARMCTPVWEEFRCDSYLRQSK